MENNDTDQKSNGQILQPPQILQN